MTTALHTISWGVSGLLSGSAQVSSYRGMQSVTQGQTDFMAYKQSDALQRVASSAFYFLNETKVYELSKGKRKWIARLIAYPIPFALQMLNHRINGAKYPLLKKTIIFLRNHIDHAVFGLTLCISALFVYYVSTVYGVGLLIGFTIEILNESKILPAKVKTIWEKVFIVIIFTHICNITFIEDIDFLDIFEFFATLIVFVWEHYGRDTLPKNFLRHNLNLETAEKILKNPTSMRVNLSHVDINPGITTKGAGSLDIEKTMETLIKKIQWTDSDLRTFKKKLLTDTRFQSRHVDKQRIEDITDEFAKNEFASGAKLLASEIANSAIEKGDSYIRYDILQDMLKSILKEMSESSDIVDDLFLLSLEGGDYCAAGKAAVIEDVFNRRILLGQGKVSLKTKFLHLLTCMRKRLFDSKYAQFSKMANKLPKGIIDPADVHFRNIALFYFDKCYRLHSEALNNDMNLEEGSFCNRLYRFILFLIYRYFYWPRIAPPDPEMLVQEISEASTLLGIQATELADWWRKEWINHLPEDQKEQLMTELTLNGSILGESLIQGSTPNPKLIRLMLVDMGILQCH